MRGTEILRARVAGKIKARQSVDLYIRDFKMRARKISVGEIEDFAKKNIMYSW